jgi:RHS repeat-associated protein
MVTILRTNTYTGQEQDEFGGLIYYNARWYDPEIGRFISEDPAAANPGDPLSINRYIYCRNNPLVYVDPTGELFAEITAQVKKSDQKIISGTGV